MGSKLFLDNEQLAEAYFEDACLLGIMAPMPDYQFCNRVKTDLGLDFRNDAVSEIILKKKKRDYYFSVFKYNEPNSSVEHYIYNNKWDGEYLLPEFKHLDFAWLIHGMATTAASVKYIVDAIKAISGVQLVIELTNEKIKNKQHLIL